MFILWNMTVRGIEAIKQYIPNTSNGEILTNVVEEKGLETTFNVNKMTSVERYRNEWKQFIIDLDMNTENIRVRALNGELIYPKFRSIYWALLLRVLNSDYRTWKDQRAQQRKRYDNLKYEFIKNPHEMKVPNDDPLSQSTQSVWNQYFNDQELFGVIRQDVIRTFPGVDFFRKPHMQDAMTNILFYYAREHPYMSYRQGMHEILAPILFVVYGDHQSLDLYKEIEVEIIDDLLLDVINSEYLEADCYSIFSRVMASVESYYRTISHENPFPNECITQNQEVSLSNSNPSEMEVIRQLNSIRDKILAKEDLHLHNYLLKMDIPLHVFGIRWLRLLFGREFPLLDILVLWDAIFADSDRFDLPNYILVAMLIRIRDKLLLNDYTTCLTYLMRYPNVDIHLVLRHALHMKFPNKYERPTNAIIYFNMNHTDKLIPTQLEDRRTGYAGMQRHRPISFSDAALTEREIRMGQEQNAAQSSALAKIKMISKGDGSTVTNIMEGHSENSPEVLRLELRNAQTIITIARKKLQKFVSIVHRNIGQTKSEELCQALNGIEELCSFLDVKFEVPLQERMPIDLALEADEQRLLRNRNSVPEKTTQDTMGKGISDLNYSSKGLESVVHTSYEKPENDFVLNTTRMLGTLKEIELIQIVIDEPVQVPSDNVPNELSSYNGLPSVDPLRDHLK